LTHFTPKVLEKPTDTVTKETFGAQCVVPVVFRGRNVLVKWFPGPLCLDEDTRGSACLHVSECRSILIEFICFLASLY